MVEKIGAIWLVREAGPIWLTPIYRETWFWTTWPKMIDSYIERRHFGSDWDQRLFGPISDWLTLSDPDPFWPKFWLTDPFWPKFWLTDPFFAPSSDWLAPPGPSSDWLALPGPSCDWLALPDTSSTFLAQTRMVQRLYLRRAFPGLLRCPKRLKLGRQNIWENSRH